MDLDSTKPRSDVKKYRLVTLQSGLEVLLVDNSDVSGAVAPEGDGINDSDSRKAAAAMCVNVGSFADPLEAQGLAHFLEHMLFMGIDSDKYPSSENLYDSFISSHGGSCNAMTDGEFTVYQFDVNVEHFAEALDIFAHCFKCPLLSTSAADREINAIESEFHLAKVSDGARLQQLLCDAAVDGHVLRKFSWGNLESLATIPQVPPFCVPLGPAHTSRPCRALTPSSAHASFPGQPRGHTRRVAGLLPQTLPPAAHEAGGGRAQAPR